jgi:hypothetical protein
MSRKRERKEKVPSLEEIEKAKALPAERSSKHRCLLQLRRSLISLWRVVDPQDA